MEQQNKTGFTNSVYLFGIWFLYMCLVWVCCFFLQATIFPFVVHSVVTRKYQIYMGVRRAIGEELVHGEASWTGQRCMQQWGKLVHIDWECRVVYLLVPSFGRGCALLHAVRLCEQV